MKMETFLSLYAGVRSNIDLLDEHAQRIAGGSAEIGDFVGILESKRGVEISTAAISRANEMTDSLLDILP